MLTLNGILGANMRDSVRYRAMAPSHIDTISAVVMTVELRLV